MVDCYCALLSSLLHLGVLLPISSTGHATIPAPFDSAAARFSLTTLAVSRTGSSPCLLPSLMPPLDAGRCELASAAFAWSPGRAHYDRATVLPAVDGYSALSSPYPFPFGPTSNLRARDAPPASLLMRCSFAVAGSPPPPRMPSLLFAPPSFCFPSPRPPFFFVLHRMFGMMHRTPDIGFVSTTWQLLMHAHCR